MAVAVNSTVPLELQKRFDQAIDYYLHPTTFQQIARARLDIEPPPSLYNESFTAAHARHAAEWIADNNPNAYPPNARTEFVEARRNEIIAGIFSPEYWAPSSMISHNTEMGLATCSESFDPIPPEYVTPGSNNSNCNYTTIASTYTTPAINTGLPNPAPGYAGATAAGLYTDTWRAQARINLDLPRAIDRRTRAPIYIIMDYTVHEQNSARGNRALLGYTLTPSPRGGGISQFAASGITKNEISFSIPRYHFPESTGPGYDTTVTRRDIHPVRIEADAETQIEPVLKTIQYLVAPAAALGKYHAGNLNQSTSWAITITAWTPRVSPTLQRLTGAIANRPATISQARGVLLSTTTGAIANRPATISRARGALLTTTTGAIANKPATISRDRANLSTKNSTQKYTQTL